MDALLLKQNLPRADGREGRKRQGISSTNASTLAPDMWAQIATSAGDTRPNHDRTWDEPIMKLLGLKCAVSKNWD